MPDLTLTATRVIEGTWHGILQGDPDATMTQPQIAATHLERALPGVEVTDDPARANQWRLKVPIPASALSDGVQTFVIRDTASDVHLGSFSIVMGDPLDGDIRAEVDLLRAELDMLKRAFRRHCLETA